MSSQQLAPAREVPKPSVLQCGLTDPSHPDVGSNGVPQDRREPVLAMDQIQGNSLVGFTKDFQTLLFLKIDEDNARHFKSWLVAQAPFVATAAEVLAFNTLFKALRSRRGVESNVVKATWMNIAFSHRGLVKLIGKSEADKFEDASFKSGLAARSHDLGDPSDSDPIAGNPKSWVIGGPENAADVIIIVESDDHCDMLLEVARIEESLTSFSTQDGRSASSGARVIFKDEGANLPPPLSGHEHFGFLDGISQPGVRGRVSNEPNDVLTLRQNPKKRDQVENGQVVNAQGKPGQELLWPGEFIFGYPGQVRQNPSNQTPETDISKKGPVIKAGVNIDWTDNGSFLVFRRLRQKVGAFHQFLHETAEKLQKSFPAIKETEPGLVGAKLVGRWPSGAPVLRTPLKDNAALGDDDCSNNNFEFNPSSPPPVGTPPGPFDCVDKFPASASANFEDDENGVRCPFTGHTRKAYPRNELVPGGVSTANPNSDPDASEVDTQTHRIMRRGIPYGPVSRSTMAQPDPNDDKTDRGLHFLAYQTSIVNQFEFITRNWVNNPNFSTEAAKAAQANGVTCQDAPNPNLPIGFDPIIGQNNAPGQNRERSFFLRIGPNGNQCAKLSTKTDWVVATGGGYFFSPSLAALTGKLAT